MSETGRSPRFYIAADPRSGGAGFAAGQEIDLPQAEAHHAAHVLRLRAGDAVELFDGCGGSARGRLARVAKRDVTVMITEASSGGPATARRGPIIALAFAVPKGSRLDWLLEKATELGVASLEPVLFERSVAGGDELSDAKRARWMGHCIAAAKQSGSDYLPALCRPRPLAEFARQSSAAVRIYGALAADAVPPARVLTDGAAARALTGSAAAGALKAGAASTVKGGAPAGTVTAGAAAGTLAIVVGPEGGLTDAERQALHAARFIPVRLGHTTLRIETAALALVAAALALAD